MTRSWMWGTAAAVLFSVGCQSQKAVLAPDFSGDLQSVADGKSDTISPKKLKVVGSLDYGQSATVEYTGASKYLAYKFGGQTGDQVVIDVTSQDGDAYAWLTDNAGKVIAKNDDSGDSTNSHIEATLPGNKSPDIITYYIVFKDYYSDPATLTVSLAQKAQTCGGIANLPCPGGQKCVDNPNDNCDPNNGGADCGGICVACFDIQSCMVGQHWSAYRCACVSDTCAENVFCTASSHWSQADCTCVPN